MSSNDSARAEYEALGIFPETWTCVSIGTKRDAERYVFDLAMQGVSTRVAQDRDDPKMWHVAVQGGMLHCPLAWLTTFRSPQGEDIPKCSGEGQHPQAGR